VLINTTIHRATSETGIVTHLNKTQIYKLRHKVLELKTKVIIGIDLAAKPENPTGWALWKNKIIEARLIHTNIEIIEGIECSNPSIIAIDAPFNLPKKGILRKADKEMVNRGLRVFPPGFPAMRSLTMRAMQLNKLIAEKGYKAIEVHPTSTRKTLSIPAKDWTKIQTILQSIGLEGDPKMRALTSHEIDAITAALTACLHSQNQTERIGDEEEGYIIIPKTRHWRTLRI
jgi:predicted nuclease with RNAse H fold